jgi:uncharacterized protein YggE
MRSWLLHAALLLSVVVSGATPAADPPRQRTVLVTGEGKASAPPDLATLNAAVVVENPDPGTALARSTDKMTRALAAIRQAGVAPRNVQTTAFNVEPVYEYRRERAPRIVGYRVRQRAHVRVRDLGRVGGLLTGLVRAGSNEVGRVSLGVQNPARLADQARREAIGNARRRADGYARAAGVRLGPVLTISEQSINRRPVPRAFAAGAGGAVNGGLGNVPVEAGLYEVRAAVQVTYALNNRR